MLMCGCFVLLKLYEFTVGAPPGKERKHEFVDNPNGLFSAQAAPKPPAAVYTILEGMQVWAAIISPSLPNCILHIKVLIKLLGHFVHLANHIKVSIRIVMWGFILLWQLIVLYVVFKLDESYTPSKVSIRAGDGFHNLKEIKTVELVKPTGWVYLSLSGADPR
ncbi:Anaphase-promoting complex subunit 10 [Glycine soja]|uniref:Anaphase-promoting complex subunit 10 n=2 Tax=Glycine soja TaxID=3848 RepID=A0A0B2REL8_GLYSO|nr:Anaphase-promoting complex subunit 10 [Glycine soja]